MNFSYFFVIFCLTETVTYCFSPLGGGRGENSKSSSRGSLDAGKPQHSHEEDSLLEILRKALGSVENENLVRHLLQNYNREAMFEMPVVIHMDMLLFQIKNMVEKEGVLETVVALIIEWSDSRLTWNPHDFSNLTFLSLAAEQVWLPDIAMTNSAEHPYLISRDHRFMVRSSFDGSLTYVPSGVARTWCKLKLLRFPFDIQQCSIEFESWSLDSKIMTFDGLSQLLIDDNYDSMQFDLCGHASKTYLHLYNFSGESFTRVRFIFTMKRKSTFYVINIIFPIMILSFIQTLSFLVPRSSTTSDRISFGTTNMLTLVVYQTIITDQLPKTSDSVTALSKYVITSIVIAALGIFESVIAEHIHNKTTKPPVWIIWFLKAIPIAVPVEAQKGHNESFAKSLEPKVNLATLTQLAIQRNSKGGKPRNVSYIFGAHKHPRKRSADVERDDDSVEQFDDDYIARLHEDPASLWIELAYKMDCLTFGMSAFGLIFSPIYLFVPLIVLTDSDEACNLDIKQH